MRTTLRWTHVLGGLAAPDIAQLAAVTHRAGKPLCVDLGWGGVADLAKYGLPEVPVARTALAAGADLVLLRGNGTLGGPICGMIAGKRELIEKIAAHPLGKAAAATLPLEAALAATLQLQGDPTAAEQALPLLRLLSTASENLQQRAERLAPQIAALGIASAEPLAGRAALSSRRAAQEELPSWCVALTSTAHTAAELAQRLMTGTRPVASRVENDRVLLDLRTVSPKDDLELLDALAALAGNGEANAAK